jgi:hypothetical protein
MGSSWAVLLLHSVSDMTAVCRHATPSGRRLPTFPGNALLASYGCTHPSALSKHAWLVINGGLFKQSVCCQMMGAARSANLKRSYFKVVSSQLTCETNMGHTAARNISKLPNNFCTLGRWISASIQQKGKIAKQDVLLKKPFTFHATQQLASFRI